MRDPERDKSRLEHMLNAISCVVKHDIPMLKLQLKEYLKEFE